MPRKPTFPDNPVADAIARCGGVHKAMLIMGVGRTTIWRWRKDGHITKLDAAVKLAKALQWSVERLTTPQATLA